MSSDAELLTEGSKEIPVANMKVTVTRFKVGHLPLIMKFMKRFQNGVSVHPDSDPFSLFELVEEHIEEFVKLVSEICSLSSEQVNEFDIDDFITIAEELLKLNADYFKKKIPQILALVQNHLS